MCKATVKKTANVINTCHSHISFSPLLNCYILDTYIDHCIGSDAEEGGSLVDGLDLFSTFNGDFEAFKFSQGALESCSMLGDEVITRAEVIKFADKQL